MAGAILGIALERTIVTVTPKLFSMNLAAPWNWHMPLQAAGAGFFAAVFVPIRALLRIREVRPYLTLRRDMQEDRHRRPPRRGREHLLATTLAIGACVALAASATGSWPAAILMLVAVLAGAWGIVGAGGPTGFVHQIDPLAVGAKTDTSLLPSERSVRTAI